MAKRKTRNKFNIKNYLSKHVPETLIVSGILLVAVSVTHNIFRSRSLSLDKALVEQYLSIEESSPTPTHIYIPWNTDAEIESGVYQGGRWTVAEGSVTYLTSSARPGEPGNIIIYGHNKREILGNIRVLDGGEQVTLTMSDGTTRKYLVESAKEVSPNETSLLSPTDTEVLTLFTCSGPLDSRRYVVRATPLQDQGASLEF